jgi:hypothetical protein
MILLNLLKEVKIILTSIKTMTMLASSCFLQFGTGKPTPLIPPSGPSMKSAQPGRKEAGHQAGQTTNKPARWQGANFVNRVGHFGA